MPAFSFVSIDADDDSVDFSRFKPAANGTGTKTNGIVTTITETPASSTTTTRPSSASSSRTLLLAPPSFAAHEEKLRTLFATYDRDASDLQMLDRLAAGLVPLPAAAYDLVLVLTDADGAHRAEALALLSRRGVYAALVPAMKTGARLQLQDGSRLDGADAREAILAGLVPGEAAASEHAFTKAAEEEVVVPLRLKKKTKPAAAAAAAVSSDTNAQGKRPAVVLDLGEYSDGDELVDEDSLLTAEERNRPPQQPPCTIDGQKRRKPCKDCTCGLAERLEEEDRTRRAQADSSLQDAAASVFKLDANDLNELDFTVKGKTGSCNSCSLGDAFRCSTCPYIGLPAFQPGEEVKILSGLVQL